MKPIKTLIIDDEWLIRLELKRMLQEIAPVEIVGEAATVAEAISMAAVLRPELIFLDLQLPDGSGFDFLGQFKGSFKLIFITAFESNWPKLKKYPALACLTKPINKEKLSAIVHTISKGEGVEV